MICPYCKINQEEKPRFHDAQIGDLLWNDELGICRVEQVDKGKNIYPIKIISEYCTDEITLEGKKYHYSPKATFFYYSPENHYLTERPEPVVEWSNVEEGIKIKSSNCGNDWEPGYFYKYDKKLALTFLVMNYAGFIDNCRFCKLAEPCKPEWRK